MMELFRMSRRLSVDGLLAVLNGDAIPSEPLGVSADLSDVVARVAAGVRARREGTAPPASSGVDQVLAEPVFTALRHLDRRTTTDIRLWHWLALGPLRDLVWLRWHDGIPDVGGVDREVAEQLAERFLGSASFRGLTHNGVGRLFWTVRFLAGDRDPDPSTLALARRVLGDTDLHMGIFDRELCAYPEAARALTRVLTQVPGTTPGGVTTTTEELRTLGREKGHKRPGAATTKRLLLRRLNHRFGGMVLESMDEVELQEIIESELLDLLS